MKLNMDSIQFESKREIANIIYALEEYLKDHKRKDAKLKEDTQRLIDLLDGMYMNW